MKKLLLLLSLLLANNAWANKGENFNGIVCDFNDYQFELWDYEGRTSWYGKSYWLNPKGKEWFCHESNCEESALTVQKTPDKIKFVSQEFQVFKEMIPKSVRAREMGRRYILTVDRYSLDASLQFQYRDRYIEKPILHKFKVSTKCESVTKPKSKGKRKL